MVGHQVQAYCSTHTTHTQSIFSFGINYKMRIVYPVLSIKYRLCCQPDLWFYHVSSWNVCKHFRFCIVSNGKWICFFCVLIMEYRNVQHNSYGPHPIHHKMHIHCSTISEVFFPDFSYLNSSQFIVIRALSPTSWYARAFLKRLISFSNSR